MHTKVFTNDKKYDILYMLCGENAFVFKLSLLLIYIFTYPHLAQTRG